MKVLSIMEPYATLIKEKKKFIETRSWKTDYRGELYIHASITKIPKEWKENKELMSLIGDTTLNYGQIICKCMLVDCVYMTKEYVLDMKEKNYQEYLCGKYDEGRYAWILENIFPLEIPIKAKGQLSIWNYYDELDIMNLMEDIDYGWIDRNNNKHQEIDETYSNEYILQSPKQVQQNKIGVCWDQVELERYYFKGNDWNVKTYFLVHYDGKKCPSHTFLTFEKNNKYYWFEHSWATYKGIHEYDNQKALLLDVRNQFIMKELHHNYDKKSLLLREYKKPKSGLSPLDFYRHCEKYKVIEFDKL